MRSGARSRRRSAGSKRAVSTPRSQRATFSRRDADLGERPIGRGAGGEHEVAGAVERAHAERHRVGDAALAGAQPGVCGQLGVVAAEQRHAEAAADERADDADRARRADVDQVEAPLGERLHGGREARHADLQARVVGHLELGDGRKPPVDFGVGAEHLDLEAATPRARISSTARVTPCVEPIPSARIATRGVSPSSRRVSSFARSLARNAVAGA